MKKQKIWFELIAVALFLVSLGSFATTTYAADNRLGITIDGSFDDWSDKPITQLSTAGDTFNLKEGSLLADTNYVYFYLSMSTSGNGYTDLQPAGYKLVIAGKTYYLTLANLIGSGAAIGTKKEISVSAWGQDTNQNYTLPNAKSIEVRKATGSGYSDTVEFSIPYSDLGLNATIVDEIALEISNGNLGTQTITTTGGSSGPYVIAGIGLAMGVGALSYQKHKKRRKSIQS